MKIAAIDGACYHNGKPDSYCAGSCVIATQGSFDTKFDLEYSIMHEHGGTNQRGEILGLIQVLESVVVNKDCKEWLVVTDSEYILNAMNNNWVQSWNSKGWITAVGEPVKNMDLWKQVYGLQRVIKSEVTFFHIKGHIIPFGKVTRQKLLEQDPTGNDLLEAIYKKYDNEKAKRREAIENAQKCALRNHSTEYPADTLRLFVAMNMMADAFASQEIERYTQSLD